jgi:hypothetical protein
MLVSPEAVFITPESLRRASAVVDHTQVRPRRYTAHPDFRFADDF